MIQIIQDFRNKIVADIYSSPETMRNHGAITFGGEDYIYDVSTDSDVVVRIFSTKREVDRFPLPREG